MDTTNVFVTRAAELLSGEIPLEEYDATERLVTQQQGTVPHAPKYKLALVAHLLWAFKGRVGPEPPNPKFNLNVRCEVCGEARYLKGWCRKHYYIARREGNEEAPFKSPTPTTGQIGRPSKGNRPRLHVLRISDEVYSVLDSVRGSSSYSLAVETIVREALGLPPLAEAISDS